MFDRKVILFFRLHSSRNSELRFVTKEIKRRVVIFLSDAVRLEAMTSSTTVQTERELHSLERGLKTPAY